MQEASPQERFWDGLAQLALMAALLFVAATFKHYGISWDEPLHLENGWRALGWYLSLGNDRSVLQFQNLYLYGALYDTLSAICGLILPFDAYETRRLLGGLVGVLGLAAVRAQARELAGPRAGALAVLLLLLTPEWIGQSFANPKDIPFATAAAWVGLAQVRLLRNAPRPSHWLLHGLALGCALGIRVGGLVLLAPLLIGLALRLLQDGRRNGFHPACRRLLPDLGWLALSLLLTWALMIAFWPWAQEAPLTRPFEALGAFSHFPLSFHFPFAGQQLESTALPWWYTPVALAVKLPEPALLGLAGALVVAGVALRREGGWAITPPGLALAAAILVPPLLLLASHAVLYDGIRHLLFLLPPLAVAAGIGLDRLAGLAERHPRRLKVGAAILALWVGWQASIVARLHPYETIWYNALVGGVAGAQGRFEMDIGGTALSEAAMRLRDHVVSREGSWALANPYRVRICGPHGSALYFLPPRWVAPRDGKGPADFYISFTRSRCADEPAGQQILRVKRMGVTLAYVLDLRGNLDRLPVPSEDDGQADDGNRNLFGDR